jgi:release factor glutamine methyltransferase
MSETTTIRLRDLLDAARARIDRADSEILLATAAGKDRAWLWAHLDDPFDDEIVLERFEAWVQERERGRPVAYLLGYREFYGRDFLVSPEVLIPRPETELLVDLALELLPSGARSVLDVGTGSGAIGLTLAAERPGWSITLSDISSQALEMAFENQAALRLAGVIVVHSDLLEAFDDQRFDLIVSNPPYVATGDPHLDRGDLRFEPEIALSCGEDGLALIRRLIGQAPSRLYDGGLLLIEHGHDQAGPVRKLLLEHGFDEVRSWTDLAGIERVSGGRLQGRENPPGT